MQMTIWHMDLCSFEIYSGNAVGNELNECQDLHVEITTNKNILVKRASYARAGNHTCRNPNES